MTPSAYRRETAAYELDTREIRARRETAPTAAAFIDSLAGMSLASSVVPQNNQGVDNVR